MSEKSLMGRKALVTGSAKRVGKAIALALAREGADVIIHYHQSKSEADEAVRELSALGVTAKALSADISDFNEARKLAQQAIGLFGKIDILVNSASLFYKTPFDKIHQKDFDNFLNIHVKGLFSLTKVIADHLMQNHLKGDIVNITDWSGSRPYNDYLPYCTSKGALITLTKSLAKALAPRIRVNAIAPGPVLLPTDFTEEEKEKVISKIPLGRVGTPEDIADAVIFLVGQSNYMTGVTLTVDGGRSIV